MIQQRIKKITFSCDSIDLFLPVFLFNHIEFNIDFHPFVYSSGIFYTAKERFSGVHQAEMTSLNSC